METRIKDVNKDFFVLGRIRSSTRKKAVMDAKSTETNKAFFRWVGLI